MCAPQPFYYFHFNRFESLHILFYRLPYILTSELFKDYKTLKKNHLLINNLESNFDIYCIVGPKDKIAVLTQEISIDNNIISSYKIFEFLNFDLMLLSCQLNRFGGSAFLNKLGFYIQKHPNKGIGRPLLF
jgi:hypothetical protein